MIHAVDNKIILTDVKQSDDSDIITPNQNHPFAFEVVSLGGNCEIIKDDGSKVEVGDYVAVQANKLSGQAIDGKTYYTILQSQVAGTIEEIDL